MDDEENLFEAFYSFRVITAIAFVLVGIFILPAYLGKWITQPVLWIPVVIFGVPLLPTFSGIILGNNRPETPKHILALYLCETYELIFQLVFILVSLIPIAFMLSVALVALGVVVTTLTLLAWLGAALGLPLGIRVPEDWWLWLLGWFGLIVSGVIQVIIIQVAEIFSEPFFDLCRAIHSNGIQGIQRVLRVRI